MNDNMRLDPLKDKGLVLTDLLKMPVWMLSRQFWKNVVGIDFITLSKLTELLR